MTYKTKLKLYSELRLDNLLVSFVIQFPFVCFAKYLVYVTLPHILLNISIFYNILVTAHA